jgi:hypothetical protein
MDGDKQSRFSSRRTVVHDWVHPDIDFVLLNAFISMLVTFYGNIQLDVHSTMVKFGPIIISARK